MKALFLAVLLTLTIDLGAAPLKAKSKNVTVLLTDNKQSIMALVEYGKGLVFALGDPWLYNEHIGNSDNRRVAANLFRYLFR